MNGIAGHSVENCARYVLSRSLHRHNSRPGCVMLLVAAVVFADMAMSFLTLSTAEAPLSWICKSAAWSCIHQLEIQGSIA